jgi:hypothetical protein
MTFFFLLMSLSVRVLCQKSTALTFRRGAGTGAGTATITTSVLLIVLAREFSQIKPLDGFILSLNVLVCPGVVSKKHSSYTSS